MSRPQNKIEKDVPSVDPKATLKIEEAETVPEEGEGLIKLKKENKTLFVTGTLALVFILVGSVALGAFFFKPLNVAPVAEATRKPIPTPQVQPELDRSKISIEVLNASGVAGAAKKVADTLSGLGYKIGAIGNTEGEYEAFEVYISKDLNAVKDLIMGDLRTRYPTAVSKGELTDGTTGVRIVLGK